MGAKVDAYFSCKVIFWEERCRSVFVRIKSCEYSGVGRSAMSPGICLHVLTETGSQRKGSYVRKMNV